MYPIAKAAVVCAHLFAQQQIREEIYNRFAFYSRDMPMSVVNASPVAANLRRAQVRFAMTCN